MLNFNTAKFIKNNNLMPSNYSLTDIKRAKLFSKKIDFNFFEKMNIDINDVEKIDIVSFRNKQQIFDNFSMSLNMKNKNENEITSDVHIVNIGEDFMGKGVSYNKKLKNGSPFMYSLNMEENKFFRYNINKNENLEYTINILDFVEIFDKKLLLFIFKNIPVAFNSFVYDNLGEVNLIKNEIEEFYLSGNVKTKRIMK